MEATRHFIEGKYTEQERKSKLAKSIIYAHKAEARTLALDANSYASVRFNRVAEGLSVEDFAEVISQRPESFFGFDGIKDLEHARTLWNAMVSIQSM
jgi:hypothetical protein